MFTFCERDGEARSITNIEKKAHIMKIRALVVKKDVKKIYRELKKENLIAKERFQLEQDLNQIYLRVGEYDKSSFGEIQTYYEDAYLKIVEARLLRKHDLIQSLTKITRAINIYGRVKRLLKERIENIQEKEDISEEELIIIKREKDLFEKCSKVIKATIKLREECENVLEQLSEKGIDKEDLTKISELTLEYQVDIDKIMEDTFRQDSETRNMIIELLKKIDSIFDEYDRWKEVDFKVF